jgi:hypothetical protein
MRIFFYPFLFSIVYEKKEEYLKLLVVEDVKTKTKMSLDHKTIFFARICIRGIKISGSIFPSLQEDLCKPQTINRIKTFITRIKHGRH